MCSPTPCAGACTKLAVSIQKEPPFPSFQVSDIIEYIYFHMHKIREPTAQNIIRKIIYLLAQSHTDEVILTLFKIEDESQK